MNTTTKSGLAANQAHEEIGRWMLADGMPQVVDLEASQGVKLVDGVSGRSYLDFFGCFGASPLGWNHPALCDSAWLDHAKTAVINKPSNSDLYSTEMAEFVATFGEIAMPEGYEHLFLIDGGGLAVENALKVAFDWKVRRNRAKGVAADVGMKMIHFKQAFHGRTGYTLSLTNTADPRKTMYFPRFNWPRISNPKLTFPATDEVLSAVRAAEALALAEIDAAYAAHGDDIAGILIEPMQCEGGDNYFRPEFLQALEGRAHANDSLFLVDEVQVGFFTSGKPWFYEHCGIQPDIIAFGKKSQQCGIIAGPRIDDVADNCFEESSRINSTWGGNLVDMVRATRILEVIRDDRLAENAAAAGSAYLDAMGAVAESSGGAISNVRGKGCLMAFDLPDAAARDTALTALAKNGLLGLGCGDRSIRFRPNLAVTGDEVREAVSVVESALLN